MATESIFNNVTIRGEQNCLKFLEAIKKSEEHSEKLISEPEKFQDVKREDVREFFTKHNG
ncbi:MAG: hypothetical protein LBS74_08525 [Oscillospiraceae bacterium]|nr:hypothetical protein [Oscillospiraceae bacterium]